MSKLKKATTSVECYAKAATEAVNRLQDCYVYNDKKPPELQIVATMKQLLKLSGTLEEMRLRLVRTKRLEGKHKCPKCNSTMHVYAVMYPVMYPKAHEDVDFINIAKCPRCKNMETQV